MALYGGSGGGGVGGDGRGGDGGGGKIYITVILFQHMMYGICIVYIFVTTTVHMYNDKILMDG